ncbi:MAG: hypothetical protein H8E34_13775 [Bacteroidetes bacterium]|nr:hypothetical protein [Bacteroidota bacterium]MBL6944235.1 hypothetical protein [Bacteroidales bacterium]
MKRFEKILFLFLLVSISFSSFAQFDTEFQDTLENKILYNQQKSYGVVLHSLGIGLNYRSGKRLSIFKTRVLEFEFVSMKSYKQVKMINLYVLNSKRYVYGKSNDAFFLRAGVFWKKLLNRKPYWGGVELRFIYGGGLIVGIAKPYYLYIITDISGTGETFSIIPERYDPTKHSNTDIYGKAPFSKGINEITIHPGLLLKAGLNFEFGTQSTKIKALEIGAAIDILPSGLTIMYYETDQIFFPTLYLSISLGKRFNKY